MTEQAEPPRIEVALACAQLAYELSGSQGTVNAATVAKPLVDEIHRLREENAQLRQLTQGPK